MYRIDTDDAVASVPPAAELGAEGFWTHGNPGTGQAATTMDQDWFNSVQENLISILAAAGLSHSKSDYSRLWQALFTAFTFADSSGSPNHIVVPPPSGVTFPSSSLKFGTTVRVRIAQMTSGATDMNFFGVGVLPVEYTDGSAIGNGDFPAGAIAEFVYDGSGHWHCISLSPPAIARMAGSILPINLQTEVTGILPMANAPVRLLYVNATPGSYTFNVPAQTTAVLAYVTGAGGGGAGCGGTYTGGGGGGGGSAIGWCAVTASGTVAVTVGAGAAGGTSNSGGGDGGDGGSSSFGSFMTATGGHGGHSQASAAGGAPGAASITGTGIPLNGGYGTDGAVIATCGSAFGGNGGTSYWGGGNRGSTTPVGTGSTPAPGSGGGGGYGSTTPTNGNGSMGANGLVVIFG